LCAWPRVHGTVIKRTQHGAVLPLGVMTQVAMSAQLRRALV
jgi:hypothetical protein